MTAITPPPRRTGTARAQQKRQTKREALLAGAAALFNARGIAGTSLADVAEAVGLTRAAVYYYVSDRSELVYKCYARSCDLTAEDLAHASQEATGLERVLAFVRRAFAPERPQVAVLNDINALAEPLGAMVRTADDRNCAALIGFVRDGVTDGSIRDCDAEIAAQCLIGMINFARVSTLWGGGASRTYRTHLRDAVLAMVENGIAAAPLAFDISAALGAGVPLIFIDKWDSELVLRTIAEKRVTHFHLVPIMFQRLLALPAEVKAKHPVDHVTYIVHGAAPCPPEVKHAMIEWFGPKLSEYYAGSEGGAGFTIDSHEWLKKPGSVGKRPQLLQVRILDESGNDLPNGQAGGIYHQLPPGGGFTYYKDEAKTNASRVDGFFTMGDVGYFDEDDYLFLTGRNAETIISGGVNIYPQEVDNELIKHDAVADSATVGIPHDEWGEQVKAVILLKPGYEPSDQLAQEILDFGRRSLPSFKVPRSLDFVTDLPRSEAGKIQRNKVRAPYWEGRTRQI